MKIRTRISPGIDFIRAHPITWISLLICIFTWGFIIPRLGFYWDDWPMIYYSQANDFEGIIRHYSYDRPFSFWTYLIANPLAGNSILGRQLFSLGLRWLTILSMWDAIKVLWPKQQKLVTYMVLIFAVYPGFYLQPMSESLSRHWIAYVLFFISLSAMGKAYRGPRQRVFWTAIAIGTAALHIFTFEYFAGLELIRPFYLAILSLEISSNLDLAKRSKHIFKTWLPYGVLWIAWAAWRFFFLELPSEPYPLVLIAELKKNFFLGVATFLATVGSDLLHVLGVVWLQAIAYLQDLFTKPVDPVHWLGVIGSVVVLSLFLHRNRIFQVKDSTKNHWQGIIFGIVVICVGTIPIWITGDNLRKGGYADRFMLSALFGAAIFFVSSFMLIFTSSKWQHIIILISLTLGINGNLQFAEIFVEDWQVQHNFFWQLYWRSPSVAPGTAFLSFYDISEYMEPSSVSFAINTLYPRQGEADEADFWNFDLRQSKIVRALQNGENLENNYRGLVFATQRPANLLFYYQLQDSCLWVLTPLHTNNETIPSENRDLLSLASLDVISNELLEGDYPSQGIFGPEPDHTWCFFYEKAELANQDEDWAEVLRLMGKAKEQSYRANYALELFPWVESYARLGQWQEATELSLNIRNEYTQNEMMMCSLWRELAESTVNSPAKLSSIESVSRAFYCSSN